MNIKNCSFADLVKRIKLNNEHIVMFGAGVIGLVTIPAILEQYDLLDVIDCYIDNDSSKWNSTIKVHECEFQIQSLEYLRKCDKNTVVFLNISRYSEPLAQLQSMECTKNMDVFLTPMLCIENFCKKQSMGKVVLSDKPLIPKVINYMWLGKKNMPDKLKKCIDSWHEFCPDYEIVEWNEDNYDLSRNAYMLEAYESGAYGFVPDYARIDILYNHGGLYMDTDIELIKNLDPLLNQEAFCGVEKWQVVNFGGCSGAVPGHPMIKNFLDARKDIHFIDENGKQNRNTCGFYDTNVILEMGYKMNGQTQNIGGMNIYAYDYFHPYDYMSGTCNITDNTFSIHRFNGGWMDENMKLQNKKAQEEYARILSYPSRGVL